MAYHLSHRLTMVHRSVSMALLYSVSYAALISHAQAANIGKTVITSAQHEPLVASIEVTDIKTADFSAGLADSTIYQQMGLTPTDSMSVRFQPTSATSGQVFITTSKPISKPFADVVLAINDGAQRSVVPKTLLMPLNDDLPSKPTQNIVIGTKKPNLPVISSSSTQPLIVKEGTPPPLLLAAISQNNTTVYSSNQLDNDRLSSDVNINQNFTVANTDNNKDGSIRYLNGSKNTTDAKFDTLNIQITRQIQPNSTKNADVVVSSPMAPQSGNDLSTTNATSHAAVPYSNNTNSADTSTVATNTKGSNADLGDSARHSEFNYTVQRNDNLWVIAQQIAEKNNLDVKTVMNEIQAQNPSAFINKNANQLKADAQLSLPNYDVMPTQKKLQTGISSQRKPNKQASTSIAKKNPIQKDAPKTNPKNTQAAKRTEKPVTKKIQTLPTAQFSVLAPGHDGSADGTKTKSGVSAGNGLSTDVLDILKSSRKNTAAQAQRLSKTSSTLDSYTRKLQLQNQKLAELQARLEKLRNQ